MFFDHKYAGHKDALFEEFSTWFKAIGQDPVNVRFGEDWKRLTKDILFVCHIVSWSGMLRSFC